MMHKLANDYSSIDTLSSHNNGVEGKVEILVDSRVIGCIYILINKIYI